MRRSPLLLLSLLAGLCSGCRSAPDPDVSVCLRKAEEAAQLPDWKAVRRALDEACQLEPRHLDANLRRAELLLKAFGEIDAAEEIYFRLLQASRPRALHGLGLCALWRGEERRARDLLEESIAERPTPDCVRDLACRIMGKVEGDRGRVLDLVEAVAAGSLRGDLLLAAAGRRPVPEELPQGWSYGLERARLLPPDAAAAEVEAFLRRASASERARAAYRATLRGDFVFLRNPDAPAAVTEKVPLEEPS